LAIWDWNINIPAKLADEVLINCVYEKIKYLRDKSGIGLDLSDFIEVENKQELIKKVEKLIKRLKETSEDIKMYDIISYLIKKIVIEKLEEIYDVL